MLNKLKSLLSAARHTFHSLPSGRVGVGVFFVLLLASCSESESAWDPYENWQTRNEAWYAQVTDSARTAIARAKAQYGDAWEDHCDWRQYKTLRKAADYNSGDPNDSICVKIVKRGPREGKEAISPYYNDTVYASHRGWLMKTTYEKADGTKYDNMQVFSQTYYGEYDDATCAPAQMAVAAMVDGFGTALQYMVPGDDWYIYIPPQLGYGANGKDVIPAYSVLLFRVQLAAVYREGTKVPSWK